MPQIKKDRSGDLKPPLKTLLKRKTLVGRNLILSADIGRVRSSSPEGHSSPQQRQKKIQSSGKELVTQPSSHVTQAPSEEIKELNASNLLSLENLTSSRENKKEEEGEEAKVNIVV